MIAKARFAKLLVPLLCLLVSMPVAGVAHAGGGGPLTTTLYAGQDADIGTVTVQRSGATLEVIYDLTAPSCMTEAHVYIDTEPLSGNLSPGNAANANNGNGRNKNRGTYLYFGGELDSCDTSYTVEISVADDLGVTSTTELYIAAHAKVEQATLIGYEEPDLDAFNLALPDTVDFRVTGATDSYFSITIADGVLKGTYTGWCVDLGRFIYTNTDYTANVYSSYDPNFADLGLVDHPENIDLVNYLLNQNWVGQTSPSGGTYTAYEVQRAIWTLIDDNTGFGGTQAHIDEIVADAYANGEGYVPGCGDVVAVALASYNDAGKINAQVIIAQVELECEPIYEFSSESAWAWGENELNPGQNGRWGWYFEYTLVPFVLP